jgi:coenzyme F420-0:L-glutamate ligase / coenzyme F420-1:gamma-L-glutamate ligase
MTSLQVVAATDIGDIDSDSDLVALVSAALRDVTWPDGSNGVADGDIVVITSKIVSKAEGRVVPCSSESERERIIDSETVRVLARRGSTRIVETRHGLVLAAAGVDESNTDDGTVVLLPMDPDASARALRSGISAAMHVQRIAIVITDTLGRAWRMGLTDSAIGVAGLQPLEDLRGRSDHAGRILHRTVIAIADEVASAAELVGAKDARRPVSVVRGLSRHVIDEDGPGAAALIRPAAEDLFPQGRMIDEQ